MFFSVAYAIKVGKGFEVLADMPLDKFLDLLVNLGYDGIEPNIADPTKFDVRGFRKEVFDRGLKVSAISTGLSYITYGYSLSSERDDVRGKAVEFFVKYVRIAEELECDKVVVGLARGRGGEGESIEMLERSLREILSATEGSDVKILIEPLNRYETRILNDFVEARDFVVRLRREFGDRVGILFDTFHACLEARDPYEAFTKVRDYVMYIHVADSNRRAPGDGMIDWVKLVSIIAASGYRGYLSVEALPSPTVEDTVRKAANTLFPIVRALGIR